LQLHHHSPSSNTPSSTSNSLSSPTSTSTPRRKQHASTSLKRSLSLIDLIFYGVGCSVGAGIYSLVGIGAHLAGPGIALSFALCGVACCFTSLSYAEFAARVPLAGSAYTFTYVSFGELCGWLVGWNLTLGYAVSASVVARSWAEYVVGFVQGLIRTNHQSWNNENSNTTTFSVSSVLHWSIHAPLPDLFSSKQPGQDDSDGYDNYECCPLAMVIIFLCTLVLLMGAKESTRFNTAMTILNLSILGLVVLAGLGSGTALQIDNLMPVLPHGWQGVGRAAGLVFFSYLGFDMVSCLSEEVKNPERNMPIGIIGSLLTSMFIYCTVSIVVVGMAPVELLGEDIPIVNALLVNACCNHKQQVDTSASSSDVGVATTCLSYACQPIQHWFLYVGSRIVSFGAIFGLTTACFACLMGQPRIFFSMAQDGLLFKIYAQVNPHTGVPTMGTILTGLFTALVACFVDLECLANAISLGTLQVFTFVNAGVIILRMTPPVVEKTTMTTTTTAVTSKPDGESDDFLGHDLTEDTTTKNRNQSRYSPAHHDERTPLLPDHGGAVIVRDAIREGQKMEMLPLPNDPNALMDDGKSTAKDDQSTLAVRKNGSRPHYLTIAFTICAVLIFAILSNNDHYHGLTTIQLILLLLLATCLCACAIVLGKLPQVAPPQTFTCPCVPIIPLLGILCNSYMMGSLPASTWFAIFLWLLVGVVFYFGYGMHHSELRGHATSTHP
jgi:basic amino acid/polyamine antiporter, APA family